MKYLWLIAVFLLPVPVQAQDQVNQIPPECRLLPDHKPSADVAYRPGVDVNGKPVVPADVNATSFTGATQTIVVPLTVDLAKRMHTPPPQGVEMEGNLGYLEIHPDGRVTYNGQDWTNQAYVLCGKQPISADGQPKQDVIKYEPVKPQPAKPAPAPTLKQAVPVPPPAPKKGELIQGQEFKEDTTE